jgi:hypothetical protein
MSNFDGYTEPTNNTEARAWRIALTSVGYPPKFCTEAEADLVNGCIMIAESDDDPRTGEQADLDRWQDETEATRKTDRPY